MYIYKNKTKISIKLDRSLITVKGKLVKGSNLSDKMTEALLKDDCVGMFTCKPKTVKRSFITPRLLKPEPPIGNPHGFTRKFSAIIKTETEPDPPIGYKINVKPIQPDPPVGLKRIINPTEPDPPIGQP